jgi:hypothetical protein
VLPVIAQQKMFNPWIFLRENEGQREPEDRQFPFLRSYLLRASPLI